MIGCGSFSVKERGEEKRRRVGVERKFAIRELTLRKKMKAFKIKKKIKKKKDER